MDQFNPGLQKLVTLGNSYINALQGEHIVCVCFQIDSWKCIDIFIEGGDRNLGHPLMLEHVYYHQATP